MRQSVVYLVIMAMFMLIIGGYSDSLSATEIPTSKKLVKTINHKEVTQSNLMLDDIEKFTPEVISEIEKYSKVNTKMLDDINGQISIINKVPEKTNYYEDGTKEEFYTQNTYYGTLSTPYNGSTTISPSDLNVKVRITANFSVYEVGAAEIPHYRLISGAGGLINCYENGYRNLVVKPTVMGCYENPNGSRGTSGWLYYTRTISSPSIGTMYSKSTNNSNYYTSAGGAVVKVVVSIEWRHGTNWGNQSEFMLTLCEI